MRPEKLKDRIVDFCKSHLDVIEWQLEYMKNSKKKMIGYHKRTDLIKIYEEAIQEFINKKL